MRVDLLPAGAVTKVFAGSNLPSSRNSMSQFDLFLPIANYFESSQTFLNLTGQKQSTVKVFNTSRRQLPEVLEALFLFIGSPQGSRNVAAKSVSYFGNCATSIPISFSFVIRPFGCYTPTVNFSTLRNQLSVNAVDYYTTDVISASSKTMLTCSKVFNKHKPLSTF